MAETMEEFVGINAKPRNAVVVADPGSDGEVRFYGEVDASPESMRRLPAKLAGKPSGCTSATRPVRPATGCCGRDRAFAGSARPAPA